MTRALITGASSGIGLEFACVFAKSGHDLVLVARNEGKLLNLADRLKSSFGVSVQVIAADLSSMDEVQRLYDQCKTQGLQVDYLVNNAGFGVFGPFVEGDWPKTEQMIDLNIKSLTKMCRLFIPAMIARRSGKVLNVASTAAFQPGPTMAVYYATKAFVLHFSEAIHNELSGTGVTVTTLCPGATESGFQEAAAMQDSALVKGKKLPSSKAVAEYGYQAMMKSKLTAIHGWRNYLMANSIRLTPRAWVLPLVRKIQDRAK